MIRNIAICCLVLSAVFCFAMDSNQICTYGLFEKNQLSIIAHLEGTSNDEGVVFTMIAIVSIVFAIIALLIPYKILFAFAMVFFLILELFLFNRIFTLFDYKEVIMTSISMCKNYLMLAWLFFQMLFGILSLIFIFKK